MPCSAAQLFGRALIRVLVHLVSVYGIQLALTQEASDTQVNAAFRRVVKAVHPDKGGKVEDAQRLHSVKDDWDAAKNNSAAGRPRADESSGRGAPSQAAVAGQTSGSFSTFAGVLNEGDFELVSGTR